MQIGVAYSEPGQQIWLNIEVPDESTVAEGIERSGILKQFPHIDLAAQKVGPELNQGHGRRLSEYGIIRI